MDKSEAIRLLGGSVAEAARAIGVSSQAISLWPEKLPARISDRVEAALWRRHQASISSAAPGSSTDSAPTEGQMSRPGDLTDELCA